jgi:hypothetical protein
MTALEPDSMFRLLAQVSPDGLTYTFARDKLPTLFYATSRPRTATRHGAPAPAAALDLDHAGDLTEDRFGSVPRWYIECTHDNAIRINLQRLMVKMTPCKV